MFGKKKQPEVSSVSMNESYNDDYKDLINQSFQNMSPVQNKQVQPQINTMQRPQINMPPIQPVNQAMIVGIEMSAEGEFIYKVVTNYQLNLGYCNLVQ